MKLLQWLKQKFKKTNDYEDYYLVEVFAVVDGPFKGMPDSDESSWNLLVRATKDKGELMTLELSFPTFNSCYDFNSAVNRAKKPVEVMYPRGSDILESMKEWQTKQQ